MTPTPQPASPGTARGLRASLRAVARSLVPSRVVVLKGPAQGRRIALTFDDGPDDHTLRYLDLLDQLKVRATFYLVGEYMVKRPALVEEYQRRGHQLGFHGHTHRHFTRLSTSALWDELRRAPQLLGLPGDRPAARMNRLRGRAMVRPPYGDMDLRRMALCHAAGLVPVMWSLDSMDWKIKEAQPLCAYLARQPVTAGEILLFHEGQDWTLDALPTMVKDLRDRGFELCTVSELWES